MNPLINVPHTARFYVGYDSYYDNRAQPNVRAVIYYKGVSFANVWWNHVDYDWKEKAGKWEYNGDVVALRHHFRPEKYLFDTLQDMLNHLEDTFVEKAEIGQ